MNFEKALKAMRSGKKVKIKEWDDMFYYMRKGAIYWKYCNVFGDVINLPVKELYVKDILADDWEVVE